MQTLERNISAAMESRGMTAAALTRAAGLSGSWLTDLKTGRVRSARIETVEKVAKALNVPAYSLLLPAAASEASRRLLVIIAGMPADAQARLERIASALSEEDI